MDPVGDATDVMLWQVDESPASHAGALCEVPHADASRSATAETSGNRDIGSRVRGSADTMLATSRQICLVDDLVVAAARS